MLVWALKWEKFHDTCIYSTRPILQSENNTLYKGTTKMIMLHCILQDLNCLNKDVVILWEIRHKSFISKLKKCKLCHCLERRLNIWSVNWKCLGMCSLSNPSKTSRCHFSWVFEVDRFDKLLWFPPMLTTYFITTSFHATVYHFFPTCNTVWRLWWRVKQNVA